MWFSVDVLETMYMIKRVIPFAKMDANVGQGRALSQEIGNITQAVIHLDGHGRVCVVLKSVNNPYCRQFCFSVNRTRYQSSISDTIVKKAICVVDN